ncbi:NinX [Vibrio phage 1.127.O._10N.286.52.E12]|nr:NinX [Vibrio phage 1.127.O._10N.286.52.E12]
MNYEEMSDFEINKAVSSLVDFGDLIITHNDSEGTVYLCEKDGLWDMLPISYFNPCNNPSDAWPIIELIWGELMTPPYRGFGTTWERLMSEFKCGKLKAAMICFLKMKGAENEK